jgi:hypothetical protein
MSPRLERWAASASAVVLAATGLAAAPPEDFALATNSEGQACRAQARYGGGPGVRMVDVYCGPWERPTGTVTMLPAARRAEALSKLKAECEGAGKTLSANALGRLEQISCAAQGQAIGRYGLVAERGGSVAVGTAYPADWGPLLQAASTLLGAARAMASGDAAVSGLREIQAGVPWRAARPGRGRRTTSCCVGGPMRRTRARPTAEPSGTSASCCACTGRFRRTTLAGEAEILAEIGLNQSTPVASRTPTTCCARRKPRRRGPTTCC